MSARAIVMQLGGQTSTQRPHKMQSSGSSMTLSKQRRHRSDSSQASSLVVAGLDLSEPDPPVGRGGRDRLPGDGVVTGRQTRRSRGGGSARPGPRWRRPDVPSWIDAAARCPSAIASIRLRGPWATSPPAQIRGCEVRMRRRIDLDARPARGDLDPGEDVEIRGLADGEDHGVGREHLLGAGEERRVEATFARRTPTPRRSSRGP